ncbi:MAG: bifunctional hydroxymethylpyrimidine kinase/phosphomethylpyrimidine kinase [Marinobacterium sp.]|nr:bifunctional hydroxymethylpyrimidine kinase/phosphomethylpyrimidine kinase [Marinobacterium sp.]
MTRLCRAIPNVLTIAGSDSGGGAGIQADIKAISATGSYACSVITALTAQNTCGVQGIHPVPGDFIQQQADVLFNDIAIDAVKIGMLGDATTIATVAQLLRQYHPANIVLDPVMVATSGDPLLAADASTALIDQLLPLADVVTPNLPEALALLGLPQTQLPKSEDDIAILGQQLLELGCKSVLIKGGHQSGEQSCDYWYGEAEQAGFCMPRHDTANTHGTGCTLSSAIASFMAQGYSITQAIGQAKQYISAAIATADQLDVGKGHGPVDHFYHLRASQV